ncbi:P-loop containing nucleoside triphosphate hydrolase protein [Mycena albidolilacea]|uniref:P-loop containing nucleoside triphosphate hydrolase protein n=1 Tax=Mycena albidolilacea TaxID=1033008 RepID=A0AAD6ZIR4_9AGAR|nr:P-loop containing nucleoside triphosphate hydrolase protein [Mycena albidolilacea]
MDQWRIALLGDDGVGKTELAITVPVRDPPFRKQFVVDNRMCFVEVLAPTANQVAEPLQNELLAMGGGFVLVFSITSRPSFDRIKEYHQAAKRVKGANAVLILIGNKCDKQSEREVSKDDGAALARQLGCEFMETSAKTAQNVDRTFTRAVQALREMGAGAEPPATQNYLVKKKRKNCIIL